MKLGILQTGKSPPELARQHGDVDDLFRRFLAGRGFQFQTYLVCDDVFPGSPQDAEGWIITGSKSCVLDGDAWIARLEDFLRRCYDDAVLLLGVCFGHQILAKALGGTVEHGRQWVVGPQSYQSELLGDQQIIAWHQDRVVVPPTEARIIGASDFCKNAILWYQDKALTIQPHPEFTIEFMIDLAEARRGVVPAPLIETALARRDAPLTSASFAEIVETFFKEKKLRRNEFSPAH